MCIANSVGRAKLQHTSFSRAAEGSGTVSKTGGEERHVVHDANAEDQVDPSEGFLWLARLVLNVMHHSPFLRLNMVIEEAADLCLQDGGPG